MTETPTMTHKSTWISNPHQTMTYWCNDCQKSTHRIAYFPPEGGMGEWRCQDKDHDKNVKRNNENEDKYKNMFGKCKCCGPKIQAFILELERR